jgi:hypothetical protein
VLDFSDREANKLLWITLYLTLCHTASGTFLVLFRRNLLVSLGIVVAVCFTLYFTVYFTSPWPRFANIHFTHASIRACV